jgi:hypothetical protein
MKLFLCTDKHLLDYNEKYLPAGKYYFNIKNFTDYNTILGNIISDKEDNDYEFKYFSLITMTSKGQSYLARRANIFNKNMPNYPSPIKLPTPKFLKKKKIEKIECSICLEDVEVYTRKRLSCNHVFHYNCIKEWCKSNNTCPNCRQTINN